jgi:hypothetical protein
MATPILPAFMVAADEYAEFRALMEDRDNLPKTHEEFVANLQRKLAKLREQGVEARLVTVPLDFLRQGIEGGHIKADSNGRAAAVAIWAKRLSEN